MKLDSLKYLFFLLLTILESVRVHFAPGKTAITLELLGQFLRFLDHNDHHSLAVLLMDYILAIGPRN